MSKRMLGALTALALTLATGCASAEKKPDPAMTADAAKKRDEDKRHAAKLTAANEAQAKADAPPLGPVYFVFDSAELSSEGQQSLKSMAAYLKQRPDAAIVLEGHADERGTEEYNLSLGQRRADVMKTFLERLGVKKSQLRSVSYGELKPAVAGGDEDAFAQNRRGEVKLDGVGRSS